MATRTSFVTLAVRAAIALSMSCQARPDSSSDPHRTVVFVCEHGAAKSVIAAAYLNRAAEQRGLPVRATARGADPQREPSVKATAGLAADGFAPVAELPRPLTRSDLRDAGSVVVFDCEEPAMVALRHLDACWNDAPAIAGGYAATRDAIRARIDELVERIAAGR